MPLAALTAAATKPTAIERALPSQDEIAWDLTLDPGGGAAAVRISASAEVAGVRVTSGGREIATTLTPFGGLSILERSCHLVVSRAEWTPGGQLLIAGHQRAGDATPTELVLRQTESRRPACCGSDLGRRAFQGRVRPGRDASPDRAAAPAQR